MGLLASIAIWPIGCFGKNLKFKDIRYFSVSRSRAIEDIALIGNTLHYAAPRTPNLYSAVIDPKAPYPDLIIRGAKEPDFSADRWSFAKDTAKTEITALARLPLADDGALVVDGRRMQLRMMDLAKKSQLAVSDIVIDRIKAPADSRGEAPAAESSLVRQRFVKGVQALMKRREVVITALSYYRSSKRAHHYLATTHVPGYPLVTMSCRKDYTRFCKLDTTCMLPKLGSTPLVGVAYSHWRRTLVVADAKRVYRLRLNSCYDVRLLGSVTPPQKIRSLTGVAIDEQRNLWLATGGLDDYHAANIYAWQAEKWLPSRR